jgi:hypothetical protein
MATNGIPRPPENMDDVKAVVSHPDFYKLNPEDRRAVLTHKSKRFAAMTQPQQDEVLQNLKAPPAERGILGKAWDWANKGLMSPETAGKVLHAGGLSDWLPSVDIEPSLHHGGFPDVTFYRHARDAPKHPQQEAIEKNVLSAVTSPASLATAGTLGAAEAPGAVGTAARYASRSMSVPYAVEGASRVLNAPTGDTGEMVAGGVEAIGGLMGALGFGLPRSPEGKVQKLSYASGAAGKSVDIPAAWKTVLPELEQSIKSGSVPKTTAGLRAAVDKTMKRLETRFNNALGPIARQRQVPTQIANDIMAQLPATPTAQNAALRRQLNAIAVDYQKPWTLGELNVERMNANARLKAFYGRDVNAQGANLRTQAQVMADKAIVEGARDIVYGAMGPEFRDLKMQESALRDITEQLQEHQRQLSNATAAQQGAPLLGKGHISTYGHPESGRVGTSVHRLQEMAGVTPQRLSNTAVRRAFTTRGGKAGTAAVVGSRVAAGVPPPPRRRNDEDEE